MIIEGIAMSEWDFLAEVDEELGAEGVHELPHGVSTAVSDGVIAALAGEARSDLEHAQSSLEAFYLNRLKNAPRAAAIVARGEGEGSSAEAAAFALGQVGLAHAIVSRAASRRVDDRFERRLRSRPLERYVRLLLDAELSGKELADAVKKDEAEISRRLKILRQIGAVECRREGNRIVNFLTPAARMVARALNMGAVGVPVSHGALNQEVVIALDHRRRSLAPELQHPMSFASRGERRHAR